MSFPLLTDVQSLPQIFRPLSVNTFCHDSILLWVSVLVIYIIARSSASSFDVHIERKKVRTSFGRERNGMFVTFPHFVSALEHNVPWLTKTSAIRLREWRRMFLKEDYDSQKVVFS